MCYGSRSSWFSRNDAACSGRVRSVASEHPYPGRPHAILLTGGNVADITAAATLVSAVAPPGELVSDKGYDAERYRLRNVIERTFYRIKDFRGIATRYDKTARNFLTAVCLVSAVTYRA